MRILGITLIFLAILLNSCQGKTKKTSNVIQEEVTKTLIPIDSTAQVLLDQKCMVCHGFEGKTEEAMIAPPMSAVKSRYLRSSDVKEEFVTNMTNWVKKPEAEKGLMRGALQEKGVMPHLAYSDEDINTIVNYIYDTEIPKPDWLDAHQSTHGNGGNGRGNGQGQGRGQGQGNGL